MAQVHALKPICPVIWATRTNLEIIDTEHITLDRVGEKAFGLSSLPTKWTLPYFVISDKLFDDYVEDRNIENVTSKWTNGVMLLQYTAKSRPKIKLL